jgi:Domain of unknown function (DUF4145)
LRPHWLVSITVSHIVPPSVRLTAFSCPHCSAFTTQYWYDLLASAIGGEKPVPFVPSAEQRRALAADVTMDPEEKNELLKTVDEVLFGLVFLDSKGRQYGNYDPVLNLHISKCYHCKKFAVWIFDRLLFPAAKSGVMPNADLPPDVIADFEEARGIVEASPRGAAALLRLCVQKLCKHLGESGKDLDADIGSLVKKGLNPLVQRSLDIVRVIGNEAVHPGVIDLNDDRDTAMRLFEQVNAIADQMISHPKAVSDLYNKLPESKRKAIEKRDKDDRC